MSTRASRRALFSAPFLKADNDNRNLELVRGASSTHPLIASYRSWTASFIVCATVVASVLATLMHLPVDPDGTAVWAWVIAAMLVLSSLWSSRRGLDRLADCFGAIGLAWIAAVPCAAIALTGLRLGFPLRDPLLLSVDHRLGVDALAVIEWELSQGPRFIQAIALAYGHTMTAVALSIAALSLLGARIEAWRAVFCFVGSLLSICLIAMFTPAKGLGVWASDDLLARLGPGSMRYFWQNFDAFYRGEAPVLSLHAIDGVVSFPSFHTVMGLVTVAMWRRHPATLLISCLWFALMLLATMPLGGHYLVDLVGGATVWGTWFAISRRIENRHSVHADLQLDD